MGFDLVVRNAQLRRRDTLVDIGVADGRVAAIAPHLEGGGREEIDGAGRLVTRAFADPHCHIDKSFFGELTHRYDYRHAPDRASAESLEAMRGYPRSGMGDFESVYANVIPLAETWAFKRAYSVDAVQERIARALRSGVSNGLLAMRMFCDVDSHAELKTVQAAVRVRDELQDVMKLQVVAFPQEGVFTDPAAPELMREAMRVGADVVGGIPFIEWDEGAMGRHIDFCFDLATEYGKDLHFLCDDTRDPFARTLEAVAVKKLQSGFRGRVASSHNGALSHYPDAHAVKVINLIRQAGVDICANAHVNLLGAYTRVSELLRAGVTVAAGQDDIDNFYYPFGQPDPLEIAFIVVHAAQLAHPQGMETAFDMVSGNAAKVMGLDPRDVSEDAAADLIIFDASHVRDVLRYRAPRSYVIAGGRVVAQARVEREIHL